VYKLTLTKAERDAIDWVGGRYPHGDELFRLLTLECKLRPFGSEWTDANDIEFEIPEWVAWEIQELIEEGLDCFSDDFRLKLYKFCEKIV